MKETFVKLVALFAIAASLTMVGCFGKEKTPEEKLEESMKHMEDQVSETVDHFEHTYGN